MLYGDLARAPLMASVPILHSLGLLSFGLLLAIVAICVFLRRTLARRLEGPRPAGARRRGRARRR